MRQGTPLLLGMGCSWTHTFILMCSLQQPPIAFATSTIPPSEPQIMNAVFASGKPNNFNFFQSICALTHVDWAKALNRIRTWKSFNTVYALETKLIAQGCHLSGTSFHCFLWLLLMDLFYSKFSSWLAHFLLNYLTLNWIFCSFWREFLVWIHLSNLSLL
jgi:hypothetical protein